MKNKNPAPDTLIKKFDAVQEIGTTVPIPFYNVSRIVHGSGHKELQIFGQSISLGADGDYASLEECRFAIEWFVKQLGGTVKWKGN